MLGCQDTASIVENRAIFQHCRSHVVGGISSGLDIWETAHIPSLLNNCEMWTQISEKSLEKLEDLQNTLYRMLLAVPKTTSVASLAWDMGGLKMKYRIILKKLLFLQALAHFFKLFCCTFANIFGTLCKHFCRTFATLWRIFANNFGALLQRFGSLFQT